MRSISRTARGPRRAPARLVTPRSIGTPTSATSSPSKSGKSATSGRYGRGTSDSAFLNSAGPTSVSFAPVYLARNALSFVLSIILGLSSAAAAHARQHQMLPWIRHFADCDLDQGRAAALQRHRQFAPQAVRSRHAHPGDAEAFGHL